MYICIYNLYVYIYTCIGHQARDPGRRHGRDPGRVPGQWGWTRASGVGPGQWDPGQYVRYCLEVRCRVVANLQDGY